MTDERGLGGLCLVAVLAGAVGATGGVWSSSRVSAQTPANVLTATQVNLVDDDGRLRAVLSGRDERGMASVAFYDAGGQPRALVGVSAEGVPEVRLSDAQGRSRLQLVAQGEDAAITAGLDGGRQTMVGSIGGVPILSLTENGRARMQMQMSADGVPSIGLFTAADTRALTLGLGSDGSPAVAMYGADARPRMTIGVIGNASLINLGNGERTRLIAGVAENGRPSITFLDETGTVVSELP